MVYPSSFHKIVLIGSLYSDIFNMTVSMIPSPGAAPVATQPLADDIASAVATWWPKALGSGGVSIISAAVLREIKVNRIDASGHYQDPDAMGKVLTTPVPGGGGSNLAPQLTIAATLRGTAPRALAGRGRIYLPPSGTISTLGTDGRIPASNCTTVAQGVMGLFAALNDVYLARSVPCVVGIASNTRGGAFQALNTISVGRVVDTMRSRRNKLPEDPQEIDF